MRAIYDSFEYEAGITEVHSPIEHALSERRGVCQDFAHIMIAMARAWGMPARYVSGYLYHRGSRDRSGADATHAWVEAYLPSLGWVGFDPTNNILAGERHSAPRWAATMPMCRRRAAPSRAWPKANLSIAVAIEPTQAPVRHEDFLKVARPMASPQPRPPCRSGSITSSSNSSSKRSRLRSAISPQMPPTRRRRWASGESQSPNFSGLTEPWSRHTRDIHRCRAAARCGRRSGTRPRCRRWPPSPPPRWART